MVSLLLFRLAAQAGETERLLTLHDATVAGVLLVGIIIVTIGFLRGHVYSGAAYRKLEADRDRWMGLAWAAANTARTGVQTAHEAARTLRVITENGVPAAAGQPVEQQPMGPYGGAG
jgi:hypothetical protein